MMNRISAIAAAVLMASVAFSASPATARGKAGVTKAGRPAAVMGIDPALLQEAIIEANYSATRSWNPEARTATIEATDGKSGWSVNFSGCADEHHCGSMKFYTLWKVSNEANVCAVWGRYVTNDPTQRQGKTFCYTVPNLEKQFHLMLSSEQAPYMGMDRLARPQAKERMQGMIRVWANDLAMLPQAWTIARAKCPRRSDRCA